MLKGIVFDLDHTLFDRYATLRKIMDGFCEHFDVADGITPQSASELLANADKNFVHIGWELILQNLTERGMFKTPPEFHDYEQYMLSRFREVAVPFDFAIPTLEMLRAQGYKTGLITNGSSKTQRAKLNLLGLEPHLDEILISGEFGAEKPSPEPFLDMARRLNAEPAELMYVGDHPLFDVDASSRVGYTPVWVRTTGTWVYPEIEKPEIQVDTVAELPEILRGLSE